VALCPHFGTCGGCQTQDVPYVEQLSAKQRELQRLLRATLGRAAPSVRPLRPTPTEAGGTPWHFRHKAAFVFGPASQRGRFVMGHFAAGSKTIVPVETCPVHSARANTLAFALRDLLAGAGLGAAGTGPRDVLRHVIVRTTRDDREAIVMLVVTRNDKALRAPLRAFLASPHPPDGLFVNVHDRPGPYMVGDETLRIHGKSHVRERVGPASFLVSPDAFFQTNPDAAAVLLDEVLGGAGRPRSVLDLYSGSGLFALPLALRGSKVLAVDENRQSVEDARANQRLNRIGADRVRFVAARAEDAVRRLTRERPELVILDPPRSGCPVVVLDAVFQDLRPPRAIYVSCNPETLARELPRVVECGYSIARVQPVDMFPHTPHIETVVFLDRR
jgi:23S rRNA (uracil1939-C5)-methyltransferase